MSKNIKNTGKLLVIQLGREQSQLVLLQKGSEVLYSTVLTTPMGAVEDGMIQKPDAVRMMLQEALREPELKRVRKVVFALCTSQAITETVTTPNLPQAKLEKLIQANADMYFPLDVQDYRLTWQIIGPKVSDNGLTELNVQLWAIPNVMLSNYYAVANDCGLSVCAIDYCGHSVATVAGASFGTPGKGEKKKAKLDLNMEISFGKKKAKAQPEQEEEFPRQPGNVHTDMHILLEKDILGVTCVQKGQVVFQRFIRCGAHPSYQLGELSMMVEYFRAMDVGRGSDIVGILSGSMAMDPAMAEELRDMLGISLGLLDFPYDLPLVCCIGAAKTDLDFGIPSLNKASKAMQEMRNNLWQYALILVGGLMLITSVFSLLTARLTWNSNLTVLQSNVFALQTEAQKYDGFADKYDDYIAAYNAYSNDWDSVYANLQTYNDNLVLVLDELEQLLPEKATVADMQIGATGLNVTFACETKEQAAYIMMALREMQYADLLAVSSLSGGGAGPAKSYGTGKTTEKAPVEGGARISSADRLRLKESLDSDMDPFQVGYYMGLGENTPDLLETLYDIYGAVPENEYEVLEEVPATLQQRSDALYAMCMNNPFAMRAAEDMLLDHYQSGGKLSQYVPQSSFVSSWYSHRTPKDLESDLKKTLNQFYLNETYSMEELMPVLEEVIKENPEAELWYIYYLEGELADINPRPYLDLDAMVDDLADGTFDTYDPNVNIILTNLLSADTQAILEEIKEEPQQPSDPSTEPSDPSSEPSSEPSESTLPSLPTDPSDPFASTEPSSEPSDPSTEPSDPSSEPSDPSSEPSDPSSEPSDPSTEPSDPSSEPSDPSSEPSDPSTEPSDPSSEPSDPSTEPSDPSSEPSDPSTESTGPSTPSTEEALEMFGKLMNTYLETGKTGLSAAEEALVDSLIDEYLPAYKNMTLEELLDDQLTKYFTYGESDFTQMDDAIKAYLKENPDKEAELRQKYQKEVGIELALEEYLSVGKTNYEEDAIKLYLRTGTSEVMDFDDKLNTHISTGKVDKWLENLIRDYRAGSVSNQTFKQMFANYEKNEKNDVLNARLKYLEEKIDEEDEATALEAVKYLKDYLKNGSADPRYDSMIRDFLMDGTLGDEKLDKIFEDKIKSGDVDPELTRLIYLYAYDSRQLQTLNYLTSGIVQMLNNYHKNETGTGSAALDTQIKNCYSTMLAEYIAKLNESKANNAGGQKKPNEKPDTRTFFTVVLAYNDELKLAELERKGLNYEDKVALIKEVGEE